MTQPQRLLDDPQTSELARALLASTADDGPSPSSRAAAAKRLGIGAVALVTSSTSAGAAGVLWKLGVLALFVIGGIATVIVVGGSGDVTAPQTELVDKQKNTVIGAPVASTRNATPPPPSIPSVPVARPAPPTTPTEASQRAMSRKPPAPRAPATPAVSADAVPAPTPQPEAAPVAPVDPRLLAAEVRILDRARDALSAGDVAGALAALDEHERDFAAGSLRAEADVVRIEALIRNRDYRAARERAHSFAVAYPRSPLVKRVRSLIERLPTQPTLEVP